MIGETVRRAHRGSSSGGDTPGGAPCVCGSGGGGGGDGGGRNRDRPVRGGDQCLYLREPGGAPSSSTNEHAAHPRCAVARRRRCASSVPRIVHPRRATRSSVQGVPDNDRHIGACTQA